MAAGVGDGGADPLALAEAGRDAGGPSFTETMVSVNWVPAERFLEAVASARSATSVTPVSGDFVAGTEARCASGRGGGKEGGCGLLRRWRRSRRRTGDRTLLRGPRRVGAQIHGRASGERNRLGEAGEIRLNRCSRRVGKRQDHRARRMDVRVVERQDRRLDVVAHRHHLQQKAGPLHERSEGERGLQIENEGAMSGIENDPAIRQLADHVAVEALARLQLRERAGQDDGGIAARIAGGGSILILGLRGLRGLPGTGLSGRRVRRRPAAPDPARVVRQAARGWRRGNEVVHLRISAFRAISGSSGSLRASGPSRSPRHRSRHCSSDGG